MTERRRTPGTTPKAHAADAAQHPTARCYLTIAELAATTGMSVSTLGRLKKRGLLPFFQPGGPRSRVLFPADAVERTFLYGRKPEDSSGVDDAADDETAPRRGPRPKWLGGAP
jgi:excisionase family DNA binding protein